MDSQASITAAKTGAKINGILLVMVEIWCLTITILVYEPFIDINGLCLEEYFTQAVHTILNLATVNQAIYTIELRPGSDIRSLTG